MVNDDDDNDDEVMIRFWPGNIYTNIDAYTQKKHNEVTSFTGFFFSSVFPFTPFFLFSLDISVLLLQEKRKYVIMVEIISYQKIVCSSQPLKQREQRNIK